MIKLFQTISKKYFDNTVALSKLSKTFFVWVFGLGLVYITNIYLIKLIGLDQYGQYTVFMSWVSLISMLVAFGWDGYLIQKIPQLPKNEAGKITNSGIIKKAVVTTVILFIVFTGIIVLLSRFSTTILSFLGTGQLTAFLSLIFLFALLALLRSFLKIFNWVITVQWVEDFLKPLALFAVIIWYYKTNTKLDISSLYFINLFVFGAVTISLLIFAFKLYKNNFATKQQAIRDENWLSKCFYFMCIFLGYNIFSRMELLFLGFFVKNEEAAKYQILLRIADLVYVPDILFNYFLPQKFAYFFADKKMEEAKELYRNSARTILLLQVLCFLGASAVGYFYLQSFGIASVENYILLLIACSAPVFTSLFGSTNLVLKASGNERFSFYALLIILSIEALANSMLIPLYGLTAAVALCWGSILLYNLLLSFFVHKRLGFYSRFSALLFPSKTK